MKRELLFFESGSDARKALLQRAIGPSSAARVAKHATIAEFVNVRSNDFGYLGWNVDHPVSSSAVSRLVFIGRESPELASGRFFDVSCLERGELGAGTRTCANTDVDCHRERRKRSVAKSGLLFRCEIRNALVGKRSAKATQRAGSQETYFSRVVECAFDGLDGRSASAMPVTVGVEPTLDVEADYVSGGRLSESSVQSV
jgi:hypothetical protein